AYPRVSVMAISVAAAVAHNITQNIVFVFLSGSALMFGYMPYLILVGVLSGAIVGGVILIIFRGVPKSAFEKVILERNKKQEKVGLFHFKSSKLHKKLLSCKFSR
ncbi:MAG: Gx transporter family protein, partial [Muribaculaceae bacterium]|nr:Gx transporter family protein [Muribaculaceae bacterium]